MASELGTGDFGTTSDVREIAASLEAAGVEMVDRPEEGSSGPGSVILSDPDGNQILIDQFF